MICFTFLKIWTKSICLSVFVFDSSWRTPCAESCAHFFCKSMWLWNHQARVLFLNGFLFEMLIFIFPVASVHDFTSYIFMTIGSNLILSYILQCLPKSLLFIWKPLQIVLSNMQSCILPSVLPIQRLIEIPRGFRLLLIYTSTLRSGFNRRSALLGRHLNALGSCLTSHLLRYSVCSETVEVVLVLKFA